MRLHSLLGTGFVALATASVSFAQANDECPGATAVGAGNTAFDTTAATTSAPAWPCALGGSDLWYSYTATGTNVNVVIDTCGSFYDTALEAFSGTCGSLTSIACNDDTCGLQSSITVGPYNTGDTVIFRIGGFNSATGTGSMNITEVAAPLPPPPNCLETLFAQNNQGSVGGAIYFDLTNNNAGPVNIAGIDTNDARAAGTPCGLEVWINPAGHAGNETSPAGWVKVAEDDGTSVTAGSNNPTSFTFTGGGFLLPAGTSGIALVGTNSTTGLQTMHTYTNGNGANQAYASADGVLASSHGTATNVPFTGGVFSPRVWNGRVCHGMGVPGPVGTPDPQCVTLPNSSGNMAVLSLISFGQAGDDIDASVSGGPMGNFGYYISGPNPGLYIVPPGSNGIVCIAGPQYRYNGSAFGHIYQFDGAGQSQALGGGGPNTLQTDGSFAPVPAVVSGMSRAFQSWFRDGTRSNFSDSLIVQF